MLKFHGAKKVPVVTFGVTNREKSPVAFATTGLPLPPGPCHPVTWVAVPAEAVLRLTEPVKVMLPVI